MQGIRLVQMAEGELNEFLGRGGTGVLSFSTGGDDPPFSLPVSYGYNADSGSLYYRLASPPDSGKADVLGRAVSFVAHAHTDDGWRSVVATGRLEELAEAPHESSAGQGTWAVRIPRVDIFDARRRRSRSGRSGSSPRR